MIREDQLCKIVWKEKQLFTSDFLIEKSGAKDGSAQLADSAQGATTTATAFLVDYIEPLNFFHGHRGREDILHRAAPFADLNGLGFGMHQSDGFSSGSAGPDEVLRSQSRLWYLVPHR